MSELDDNIKAMSAWIIDNQDKQGTGDSDFDTVAAELQRLVAIQQGEAPEDSQLADALSDSTADIPDELPVPTAGMYRGLDADQQQQLYQSYLDDPRVSDNFFTGPSYQEEGEQAYMVPRPKGVLSQVKGNEVVGPTVTRNVPANLLENAANLLGAMGAIETKKSGTPIGDYIPKYLQFDDDLREIARNIPKVEAGDNLGDAILQGGTELTVGMLGAQGLIGGTLKGLVKTLGLEVGAVATLDPDIDSGLLVGEDSAFGLDWDPFDATEEGIPSSVKETREKLNLILDGALSIPIVEVPLRLAAGGLQFIYGAAQNVLRGGKVDTVENAVVRDLLDTISSEADETPEQLVAKVNAILENTDNSKVQFLIDEGDKQIEILLNTLQILERDASLSDVARQQIRRIQDGVRNSSRIAVDEAGQQKKLQETITEKAEQLGGEAATEQAGEALAEVGQARIAPQVQTVEELSQNLANTENRVIDDILAGDDAIPDGANRLQEVIALARQEGPVDLVDLANKSREEIADDLFSIFTTMFDKKNRLFSQVRGGSIADEEGVTSLIRALDAVEATNPTLKGTPRVESQLQKLLDLKKPQSVTETNAAGDAVSRLETEEEVIDRIIETLEKTQGRRKDELDLGYFYREIRPQLAQMVDSIKGFGGPIRKDAANPMQTFIDYIDAEMDALADAGNMTGQAAREAMDYYKNSYKPVWGDSPLQDLHDLYRKTSVVTKKGADEVEGASLADDLFPEEIAEESGQMQLGIAAKPKVEPETLVKQPIKQKEETMTIINEVVRNPEKYLSFERMAEVLEKSGETASQLHDLVYVDLISSLQTALKTGDIGTGTVPQLLERVSQYGAVLRKSNPQQADEVNKLLQSLSKDTQSLPALQRRLAEAQEAARVTREEVLDSVLGGFLERKGLGVQAKGEPKKALRSIFGSEDTKQLEDLMKEAVETGDPRVVQGIQAEYLRQVYDKVFINSGATAVKGQKVSLAQLSKGLKDSQGLFDEKRLAILFSDNPTYAKGLKDFAEFMQDNLQGMSTGMPTFGPGTAERAANIGLGKRLQSLQTIITIFLGRLNRRAATAGNIGSSLIRKNAEDMSGDVSRVLGELMTDPQKFKEVLDNVMLEDAVQALTSPRSLALFANLAVRGGVYSRDEDALSPSELLAISTQLREDIEAGPDTDQQTEELLQE